MLNRNKIFKTVRDTTNTLNVLTSKNMDNFYTELMTYENMVQKKYDKIRNLLNTLKYHHNKIENLNKNYNNAIFGGGKTDLAKLMKDIDSAIDSIDILNGSDGIINNSKFDELINKKNNELKTEINDNDWKDGSKIQKIHVTENNKVFFHTANDELIEIKKEFDENRKYINDLVEKIKKIEDPVNQYILDKKLSKDFRQGIKEGIRSLSKLIDNDSKDDFQKFNTYKNNITSGLAYAKAEEELAKKLEKDPNASDDVKILQQFKKDKNSLQFIFNSSTSGQLKVGESSKIDFDFTSNSDNTYTELTFPTADYIQTIYVKIIKEPRGAKNSPSKEYFLDFATIKRINDQKELKSYVSSIYTKLEKYAEPNPIEPIEPIEPILNYLVDNKIFSMELLKELKTIQNKTIKEIVKKPEYKEKIKSKLLEEFKIFKKTTVGGVNSEKEGLEKESLKKNVNKTNEILKKIRKQIEEDYDKEYNSTNKPQEPKQNDAVKSAKTMFGVNTQEDDEDNKITNSIISSIIENYEKERSSVNTIEDKIKLDTKFVDILDNLGLNLADIFKINFEDKLSFIFFILILHIVVYSVIESLIMNDYLTDIVYIMAVYVGIYFLIMFILILILNKYVNYRMKSILNYLNTDFNMQLITMHLFIVFMFYIIVLILSQHIDIFTSKEEDDKLQILYRIEVISSIIFIFSGVFVMLL